MPGVKSSPPKPSLSRWWLIGGVGVVVAIVAWHFWPSPPRPTVTLADAASPVHVAPPPPIAPPRPMAARVAKSAPSGKLSVLRTASREEVLAYAHDVLAGDGPLEDIVALLEFLVEDRPALAVDLAREIGRSDGERQVLLYATLSAWADKDASGALSWAFRNSAAYDIPGHASLLYIVLEQIATDDPKTAVATTEAALQSDPDAGGAKPGQDVARFTLEALIKHGHSDVAQEAIERWSRGPEKLRLNGSDFEIVAMGLAGTSYEKAGAWLASLPSSPARNEAYGAFAEAWAREDNRAAMDWAQTLKPADGGDDVRVATFGRWVKFNRDAAAEWLRNHNDPDPTRDRLRALLDATAPE